MDANAAPRWGLIKRLFHEAMERPQNDREAYLTEACGGDEDLLTEVQTLLDHATESESFLEAPVRDLAADLIYSDESQVGWSIGSYKVVEELAQGGMGTVYLAERDDQEFEQRVAIKVLRKGIDTDDIVGRFRSERQILARLNHPGIAGLIDGGATRDGRPYFVMELVEGVRITEYVRSRKLREGAIVDLFLGVCDAVEHAHKNLILHRDLKPSNIMVDQDGRPKLLDFGISKVLDDSAMEVGDRTTAATRYLTPSFASPEHVSGDPLTTAADVYSLGVILRALLTGKVPTTPSGEPGDNERSSAIPPDPIPRGNVAGDLGRIVAKAAHPDPTRRYGSVPQFSADLRRYQRGLPVQARPDSLGYRLNRFIARHRLGVSASAVVFLTVSGAAIGLALQANEIRQERDKATEVTMFLVDLFEGADPWGTAGDSLTARALVDIGAARVQSELEENPEVQATLLDALGQVYHGLGSLDASEELLREAVRLREDVDADGPALASSLNNLGILLDAKASYDDAEANLRRALAVRAERAGRDPLGYAESLNDLGQLLLYARRDVEQAEGFLTEALSIRRREVSSPHPDLAETLHNLGLVNQIRGDFQGSVGLYEESLEMRRELFGTSHPAVVTTVNNLALVLHTLGQYAQARPLMEESLETRLDHFGAGHPSIPLAQANLGLLLFDMRDHEGALPYQREAMQGFTAALGPKHPRTATTQSNLGNLLRAMGRLDEAEPLYRESLASRVEALGAEHPHVSFSLHGLGSLRRLQGRFVEADSLLSRALGIRVASSGERHPDVAETRLELGLLSLEQGDLSTAEEHLQAAADMRREFFSETHPHVGDAAVAMARLRRAQGREEQAEALFQEAITIYRSAFSETHSVVQETEALLRP